MKKLLLPGIVFWTLGAFAQNVNIPDANFKAALLDHGSGITGTNISTIDTNNDGEIQVTEAIAYTGEVKVFAEGIVNLTGFEQFVNASKINCNNNGINTFVNFSANLGLTEIMCNDNDITGINVSQNVNLTRLSCNNNNIASLDLTNCTLLTRLDCDANNLSSLDVTQNTMLTDFNCRYNYNLTTLNVTQNTALINFRCNENPMTSIDLSQNTLLENFSSEYCSLISLDLSNNVNLIELNCAGNQLTQLDLTSNVNLFSLYADENDLTSLDLSSLPALSFVFVALNDLTYLNVANGNNASTIGLGQTTYLFATNNPNLSCIQHDMGYDPTTNSNWQKDASASWSENCPLPCQTYVNIPDPVLKSLLVANSSVNTDGDGEICTTEATAFTGQLNFNGQSGITDLTGLEAFVGLTSFSLGNSQVTTADFTTNTLLTELILSNNQIASITLPPPGQLERLWITNNQMTSLDVSGQNTLTELTCGDNQLISLNVANGNNQNFTYFNAASNPSLTCIQVDDAAWSTTNWANIDSIASFSENCNLGISESNELAFVVYPNPTNGVISVDASVTVDEVEVLDITGKRVAHSVSNEVDLSSLEAGTYFVEIHHNNTISLRQIIKE